MDHHRFTHDLYGELYRIESFLEVDHKITPQSVAKDINRELFCKNTTGHLRCMNGSKGRNHTMIPPKIYRMFKNYYRENNAKFFNVIGQDLGWNDYFELAEDVQSETTNLSP